jgi:ribose transport system substrate-binding protein
MSNKYLWLWALAAIALAAAIWYRTKSHDPTSAAETTPVRVLFVTGGPGEYWDDAMRGARSAAEKFKVDIDVKSPASNENPSEQTAILERTDFTKINGLALSPLDADGQTPLINRIAQVSKVVTFDSDAPQSNRSTFVGTNNYAAGQLAARVTRQALPDGGKVALLVVNLTKDNIIDRKSGFTDAVAAAGDESPKIDVVDILEDQGRSDQCAKNIRKALTHYRDLGGFVAMNGFQGPILVKTLREDSKLGELKLITFDDAAETIAGIEEGTIYATVVQDPYQFGYEAVRILAYLNRGGEFLKSFGSSGAFNISPVAVTKTNLGELRQRAGSRK